MFDQLFASNKRPRFRNKGPWEKRSFDLSGCTLEITMPPHDWEFKEEDRGTQFNVFDESRYSYDTEFGERDFEPHNKGISYPGIYTRKWDLCGSPFTGSVLGYLQATAVFCDISKMNTRANCFNKEHLETLYLHLLYFNDGPGAGMNKNIGPENWRILNLEGIEWIYAKSRPVAAEWFEDEDSKYYPSKFTIGLMTPLFKDKYLYLSFRASGHLPSEPSNKLMLERIDQMISSIKLTLSPESLKQKTEEEVKNPSAQYSKNRMPENWQYCESWREGDPSKSEFGRIFEGDCSPPPPLP